MDTMLSCQKRNNGSSNDCGVTNRKFREWKLRLRPRRDITSSAILLLLIVLAATSETTAQSPNLPRPPELSSPAVKNSEDLQQTLQSVDGNVTPTPPSNEMVLTTNASHPVPQGASRDQDMRRKAMGSLLSVAVVVSLCLVAFVALTAGAYCLYKHAGISAASRRVFYRSSDSSVLIRNDYQPMAEQAAHETAGNGHVSTKNDLSRLAEKTDYPAYGVTGPNPLHYPQNGPPIDNNLNRSAEVYHYQQQKQKLKALNSASSEGSGKSRHSTSDTLNDPATETNEDDEENSDGEYTVYECPGLASTTDGPLEIHNPLFADSESSFTSYGSPPLGSAMVPNKYGYPPTVANQG